MFLSPSSSWRLCFVSCAPPIIWFLYRASVSTPAPITPIPFSVFPLTHGTVCAPCYSRESTTPNWLRFSFPSFGSLDRKTRVVPPHILCKDTRYPQEAFERRLTIPWKHFAWCLGGLKSVPADKTAQATSLSVPSPRHYMRPQRYHFTSKPAKRFATIPREI